jgi:ABC-type lipoprotein release transport system permease subunit
MSRSAIPLKYNLRNLFVRRVSTSMTVLGISLVVAVFLLVMSLAEGVRKTFEAPVSTRSIVALRVGAQSDVMSVITREEYEAVRTLPGIDRAPSGEPLVSPEIVVLVSLPRKDGRKTNVILRGVEPEAFLLRPALKIVEGRAFRPGTNEVVVSRRTARRFASLAVGGEIRSGIERWIIVGHFEAANSPYDSEVWADLHNLQEQSQREGILSVVRLRARDAGQRVLLLAAIRNDQRIKLAAKTEEQYFSEQQSTAKPIEFLAWLVGVLMAIGATFGAMNTMYAQVAARTTDVATLRALGYSRAAVVLSFVIESMLLALIGGALGALAATLLVKLLLVEPTGTQNFATFAEVLFNFRITPSLVARGLVFSLVMGVAGGLLPALRAARLKITTALRAA